jgi:hypothetical protein
LKKKMELKKETVNVRRVRLRVESDGGGSRE